MIQETFNLQVAGHGGITLVDEGRVLVKKSTSVEHAFYKRVAAEHEDLAPLLPKLYPTPIQPATDHHVKENANAEDRETKPTLTDTKVSAVESADTMLAIENLTLPFKRASVLDIKLGTRLYDDRAPEEKKQRMIAQAKKTTSGSDGVRLCGAKMWDASRKNYRTINRETGRSVKTDTLYSTYRSFYVTDLERDTLVEPAILQIIIEKLEKIRAIVQTKSVRLYSSSVLIIYESDPVGGCLNSADVRMIDFAHSEFVAAAQGPDDGYLFGLNNVITMTKKVSAEAQATP